MIQTPDMKLLRMIQVRGYRLTLTTIGKRGRELAIYAEISPPFFTKRKIHAIAPTIQQAVIEAMEQLDPAFADQLDLAIVEELESSRMNQAADDLGSNEGARS